MPERMAKFFVGEWVQITSEIQGEFIGGYKGPFEVTDIKTCGGGETDLCQICPLQYLTVSTSDRQAGDIGPYCAARFRHIVRNYGDADDA